MPNYVQLYKSTDLNAPPIQGIVNSLIRGPLNACLVDGYSDNGIAITSLTRAGTVATATCSADDILRLQNGNILTISGVTGVDASLYNGTYVVTVASATTFTYTMSGTPTATATGAPVWSKKLNINSISRVGSVATATLMNNNATLVTGNWVTIEGVTGADAGLYNGTYQITVLGVNSFSYTMAGTPGASAAGSPTYYKAGLQWTRPFAAGVNSQTYRSADSTSNRFYLQVIDNAATAGLGKEAQHYGAEVMTGDQAIASGQFPTAAQNANGFCSRKSATASTLPRGWWLFGDDRTFYFSSLTGDGTGSNSTNNGHLSFGHFISFKAGDSYNTFCGGGNAFNTTAPGTILGGWFNAATLAQGGAVGYGMVCARAYTQIGSSAPANCSVPSGFVASGVVWGVIGNATSAAAGCVIPYPNAADNGFYVQPVFVSDLASNLRGRMPGYYSPLHTRPFNHYDTITGVAGLAGVTLTALDMSGTSSANTSNSLIGQVFADTFGPWV